MYSKFLTFFYKTGFFPILILAITALGEFIIAQNNTTNLIVNQENGSFVQIILFFVRFASISFLLVSWTWFAGTTVFEENPSIPEAITIGKRKFFGCIATVFPLWFIINIYASITFFFVKLFSLIFFQINIFSGILSILFVGSLAMPFLIFFMSKFLLIIPTTTFEKKPSFATIIKASSYIPLKKMAKSWEILLVGSIALILTIILPSLTFTKAIYFINPVLGSVNGALITQLTGLAILFLTGPFAINFVVKYYFQIRDLNLET